MSHILVPGCLPGTQWEGHRANTSCVKTPPAPKKGLAAGQRIEYIDICIQEDHMELFGILGIVAVWYILNRWVLPRLGVQT